MYYFLLYHLFGLITYAYMLYDIKHDKDPDGKAANIEWLKQNPFATVFLCLYAWPFLAAAEAHEKLMDYIEK